MNERIKQTAAVLALGLILISGPGIAETWRLQTNQAWQNVQDSPEGQFMMGVSQLKQAVEAGNAGEAEKAFERLKTEYPQLAGPDFNAFMDAERVYAQRRYERAIKKYDKFLNAYPESWLFESALERKYALAARFLHGEKRRVLGFIPLPAHDEGAEMMRAVADRAGESPIGHRALATLAESQKRRGKFLDEYETWAEISSRWPTGELGRDAQLGMAYSLHSAYKGPKYDSSSLSGAKTYYENIAQRYPEEAKADNITAKIDMVEEQRAYKEYKVGEYYERTEQAGAAIITYESVMERWPGSTGAHLAKERLVNLQSESPVRLVKKDYKRKAFDAANVFFDKGMAWTDLSWILKDE